MVSGIYLTAEDVGYNITENIMTCYSTLEAAASERASF